MHFEAHNHVGEVTNGGFFAEKVGTVMHCSTSWRLVAEHHECVKAFKIVFAGLPSLVENPNQTQVGVAVLIHTSWPTISATLFPLPSSMERRAKL